MDWLINLFKNIVFQTVISGVLVFVIGQIIQRFFLEPIQKYKAVIGKIDNKLKFYKNIITNPGSDLIPKDIVLECSGELRKLSCKLEEIYKQIPFRGIIKPKEKISDSASRLIGLSNSVAIGRPEYTLENNEDIKRIRENLNIPAL